MGSATIINNIGKGLYIVQLNYDRAALEAERDRLRVEIAAAWREIDLAFEHRDAMRQDQVRAYHTLSALVKQWKDALLDIGKSPPQVAPEDADEDGNNPDTGQPYTEEEREDALRDELAEKVNLRRAGLSRPPLTLAQPLHLQVRNRLRTWSGPAPGATDSDRYLAMLNRLARIDREGRDAVDRLNQNANGLIIRGMFEAAAAGQTSADETLAAWEADPTTWAALMDGDATHANFGYRYDPQFPATQMWSAMTVELLAAHPETANYYATDAGQDVKDAVREQAGDDAADGLDSGEPGGDGGGGIGGGSTAGRWAANTEYGVGVTIEGTYRNSDRGFVAMNRGRYGLSGATEPLWPAIGGSVGDNDLTWTVLATLPAEVNLAAVNFWAQLP